MGRKLGRRSLGATEERRGEPSFLGDVKVKVFRLLSFTFSLVWLLLSVLDKG